MLINFNLLQYFCKKNLDSKTKLYVRLKSLIFQILWYIFGLKLDQEIKIRTQSRPGQDWKFKFGPNRDLILRKGLHSGILSGIRNFRTKFSQKTGKWGHICPTGKIESNQFWHEESIGNGFRMIRLVFLDHRFPWWKRIRKSKIFQIGWKSTYKLILT